jgi:hypothetical protein
MTILAPALGNIYVVIEMDVGLPNICYVAPPIASPSNELLVISNETSVF